MNFLRFISSQLNLLPCPGCGTGDGQGVNALCENCRQKLLFFSDSYCRSCGGELDGVLACCSKCIKEGDRPFLEAAALFAYQDFGKDLIIRYKSGKNLAFARIFAQMASAKLNKCCQHWDFDMIVPVPLHWSRKFSRTFNQSELFGEFLGKEIHKPCRNDILKRIRRTGSQKYLSSEERHKNLRNAFAADRKKVKDRKILLVDDVFTTGATLSCCAEELVRAGAA